MVSASGDASLRLISGGDVQADEPALIPGWQNFIDAFKSPPHNTVDGVHYGVSLQWGPNIAPLQHDEGEAGADRAGSALYDPKYKGQITIPNNPIQIADAALLPDEVASPTSGITDPYELNKKQFDAAVNLLKQQRPLVKRYWTLARTESRPFKNGDVVARRDLAVPTRHALQAEKVPVKELIPTDGATGWADTWMLATKAPHPNCAYLWMKCVTTPKVQAQQAIILRRDARQPEGVPVHGHSSRPARARSTTLNEPLSTSTRSSSGRRRSPTAATARTTAWTTTTGRRRGRRSRASP